MGNIALKTNHPEGPDAAILDAFAAFADAQWRNSDRSSDDPQRRREIDSLLWDQTPETARGLATQLRVTLHTLSGADELWLAAAALGAVPPGFDRKLAMSDCTSRQLWRLILMLEIVGDAPLRQPASAPADDPLTASWTSAVADYDAARQAERAHDAETIQPHFVGVDQENAEQFKIAARNITPEMWEESERLMDLRIAAEQAVMDIPSPDASGLAIKYLIARGDGRDTDTWDEILEAEARRFSRRAA